MPHTSGLTVCLLQPYPMYPATTSLVNVVPKLNATGRDLLQVTKSRGTGGGWGSGQLALPDPATPSFRASRTS